DVVDLPGGVMQEPDRCLEDEDVVAIGGAAHERADVLDRVAELEAEAVEEERPGDGQVCGAQYGVAEFAGLDPLRAQHTWRPGTSPLDPARSVVGDGGRGYLANAGGHQPSHRRVHDSQLLTPFAGAEPAVVPRLDAQVSEDLDGALGGDAGAGRVGGAGVLRHRDGVDA